MHSNFSVIPTKSTKQRKPYNEAIKQRKGNKPKHVDKRQVFVIA